MKHWINDSIFYHIYPLGFCGAPQYNDFCSPANHRIEQIYEWTGHMKWLGVNALYLGPVFESTSHGYDTVDYYNVERRLGNNESFKKLVAHLKENGIRVVLDGVFNHVGRNFWAFNDVLINGSDSIYKDWFYNLKFKGKSPYNDPFTYEGWNGHYSLVKLNLKNEEVKKHLFGAVEMWMREFNIDGIRLDAADCLDHDFMRELSAFCKNIRPDFWLMGEVIHGDYNKWANPQMLDSVTNYECYKGLYSSHVDVNYFEIAYTLKREFAGGGKYENLTLYNFADNHDVNRVSSSVTDKAHLFPLYGLLFTMPGAPSVYYGSEWGIEGKKEKNSDQPLRPYLQRSEMRQNSPLPDLVNFISRLSGIRIQSKAIKYGSYKELLVKHQQFAFLREFEDEKIIVLANSSPNHCAVGFPLPSVGDGKVIDLLNGEEYYIINGLFTIDSIKPNWVYILRVC